MERRRRHTWALTALGLAAGTALGPAARVVAEPPGPIRDVGIGIEIISFDGTGDGTRAELSGLGFQRYAVDLVTGDAAALPGMTGWELDARHRYAYGRDENTVSRLTVATGETAEFELDNGDWFLSSFDGVTDASGRYWLVEASNGIVGATRAFVYDSVADSFLTPEGLTHGDENSRAVSIAADGATAVFAEFGTAGAKTSRLVSWTRAYGETDVVAEAPDGFDASQLDWAISSDARWVVFPGSTADIVPGLDDTTRIYRRDLDTGSTAVVPVRAADVTAFAVHDGGRVVFSRTVPTPTEPSANQLYVWDGSGPSRLLTEGIDGQPADAGVDTAPAPFWTDEDATRITFTSSSTNLVAGTPPASRRVYQIELESLAAPPAPSALAPNETYCVDAVGAAAGDFVGVNVTPVGATTLGYGVVHSSDAEAGGTSNVNFGPGTVDPNVAFTEVGSDGRVCFTNSEHGAVDVILDEMIVADAGVFDAPTTDGAVRLVDTRTGVGGDTLAPSEERCVAVEGADPGDFVGVNALAVGATAPGYGTLHSSDSEPGASSTINFGPGSFDPNFGFVEVGSDGRICLTNSVHGPVDLLLDQLVVADEGALAPPTPGPSADRPVDTRVGLGGTRLAASGSVCFSVSGADPGAFGGVNITPIGAVSPGYGVLRSSDDAAGDISNVNFGPGTVDPNFAIAHVGTDGDVCVTNSVHGPVDVIVDAQVVAAAGTFFTPTLGGAVRLGDTRVGRT